MMAKIFKERTSSASGAATPARKQRGTGLVELLVAAVILIVGLVAVAQLVPKMMDSDLRNRNDSSSLSVAQQELEQMTQQPLGAETTPGLSDYNFTDASGQSVFLGAKPAIASAIPGTPPPAPVERGCPRKANNYKIDFSQPCGETGYSETLQLFSRNYELRWNVVTVYGNAGGRIMPSMKMITVGAKGDGFSTGVTSSVSVVVGAGQ